MSVAKRIWSDRHERLDELLERAAPDARAALEQGRVFVRGMRASSEAQLERGDVVEVWAARERGARQLGVLLDEGELVVVDKPAGLPSEPDHHGSWSVRSELEAALFERTGRRVSVHLVSRLDAAVSGAMIVATNEAGRARLTRAQAEGRLERRYVAIAAGKLEGSGTWTGPVDEPTRPRGGRARRGDPRDAETRWVAVAHAGVRATLLALEPITGRKHQLRAHAARAGAPLYGDRDRLGPTRLARADGRVIAVERILLHASEVRLHEGEASLRVRSPVDGSLLEVWSALDGDPGAWQSSEL